MKTPSTNRNFRVESVAKGVLNKVLRESDPVPRGSFRRG